MASIFDRTRDLLKNLRTNTVQGIKDLPRSVRATPEFIRQSPMAANIQNQVQRVPGLVPFSTGFTNSFSMGLARPQVTANQSSFSQLSRGQKAANIAGNVAGMFANPIGVVGKGIGAIPQVARMSAPLSRAAMPLTSRLATNVAGRVALKAAPRVGFSALQEGAYAPLAIGANKAGLREQYTPMDALTGIAIGSVIPGSRGKKAGLKSKFSMDKLTMDELIQAEDMLMNAKKYVTREMVGGHATKQGFNAAEKEAVKRIQQQAIEVVERLSAKLLPDKQINTLKTPQAKIRALVDLSQQNRLANVPGMGFAETPSLDKIAQGASRKIEEYKLNKASQAFKEANPPKVPNTQDYLQELTKAKNQAKKGTVAGLKQRGYNLLQDIKTKMVDSTAPIEDALTAAEKTGKFKVLPKQDVRLQIDRVLRSKTLASQFAQDNGLENVIKNAPDLEALDQYLIAKHAARVEQYGKKTGRDLVRDKQLIDDLAPQYEQYAQQVSQYGQKLLDYAVDRGLVDKKLAEYLKKRYPEYVPLQRVFDEVEKATPYQGSTKAVASLSKQTVVQKLEGSDRLIESPLESLLLKTQTAFEQGEKNVAARQLAGYKSLPGFKDLVKELPKGESAPHTFSYIENGVKKTFATTPELAAAAKNLNKEQMNIILKVLSVPTRVLQLGATGLNAPFALTNLLKDQITGFINSNKAARTSIANPGIFVKSLFAAFKHDDLYDEVVRNAAGGTSFDISRTAPNLSINRIRAGRSKLSKAAYTVRNPAELLRAFENMVGRTEEITRVQQYAGTKQALLKEGRTAQDAALLGAKAARENTANFYRKGDVGRVVNYIIPFFNAGIQGSRALVRSLQTNPKGTSTKIAVGLFMPVAAATAWNMSDPGRKKVYEDIQDYEKENNLILIMPNTKLNENDRYNVIKIPLPPGLSNLTALVRRPMEQSAGMDPVRFSEIATNLITAGTSLDFSSTNKLASTFTPQMTKPFIEDYTNTNLFTGNKIVPDKMADLPPEAQVRPNTSATARGIGKLTNTSPLRVENFIRTAAAGAGSQVLAMSDKALAATGVVPPDQAQGEGPIGNLQRRFTQATGGRAENAVFEQYGKLKQEGALKSYERGKTAEKLVAEIKAAPTREAKIQILKSTLASVPKDERAKVIEKMKSVAKDQAANVQPVDRAIRSLPVQQRAKYIRDELSGKTREEKIALLKDWKAKGILTEGVIEELKK